MWRDEETRSTQNRVGLRNPGARAAAAFPRERGGKSCRPEYGINIAVSPGVDDIDQQERELLEALAYFLDAGVNPAWFTLNLSCPNTEDDPLGHQLEAETRRLCGAFVGSLRARKLDIPLWVKVSPGLAAEQAATLMRIFDEVGVRAVVATNTLADARRLKMRVWLQASGGGALLDEALAVTEQLRDAQARHGYAVDIIGCGGILTGTDLRSYEAFGAKATHSIGRQWCFAVPSQQRLSRVN